MYTVVISILVKEIIRPSIITEYICVKPALHMDLIAIANNFSYTLGKYVTGNGSFNVNGEDKTITVTHTFDLAGLINDVCERNDLHIKHPLFDGEFLFIIKGIKVDSVYEVG